MLIAMPRLLLTVSCLLCVGAGAQQPQSSPPVSVGIVLDTSGSMGAKLHLSRQMVSEFFKVANPRDEFLLVQFSDRPIVITQFNDGPEKIQDHLAFIESKGRSAVWDAVYMALQQMKKARNPRKALLLISDGGDNHSRYTDGEIRNLVRETGVPIYAIGIYESFARRARTEQELSGPGLLTGVAEQSGGRYFAIEHLADVPDVVAKLGVDLRAPAPR